MLVLSLMFLNSMIFPCSSDLSAAQQDVLISLIRGLHLRHLIVVNDYFNHNTIFLVKYASSNNIFSQHLSLSQTYLLTHENAQLKRYHPKILVLFDKESVITSISKLFRLYNQHFLSKYIWAVFDINKNEIQSLVNMYFPYDCQFFLITNTTDKKFDISEIYHVRAYTGYIYEAKFGEKQVNKSLKIYDHDFYKRRFNFNLTSLPVLTSYYPRPCWDKVLCSYTEMISEISRMMNFTLYFLNRELLKKHRDNDIRILWEMYFDLFVFDAPEFNANMVAPIWKESAYLHIKYEKIYEQGQSSPYSKPFTRSVKISIITYTILSGMFILILNYLIHTKIRERKLNNFNFIESIFLPIEAYQNQCGCKVSKLTSSRIAVYTTRILPLLLAPLYSAVITSFLTVQIINFPFKNLQGLVKDGSFKIGFENNTAAANYFKLSTDPIATTAQNKFIVDLKEMPKDRMEGSKRLCEDNKFAFVFFNDELYQLKLNCNVLQIPTPIFATWDGFLLREHSSYTRIFNRILKTFFSAGIIKRMGKSAFPKKPREKTNLVPFKLQNASQIYILCCPIYLLSIIIFIIEILYKL